MFQIDPLKMDEMTTVLRTSSIANSTFESLRLKDHVALNLLDALKLELDSQHYTVLNDETHITVQKIQSNTTNSNISIFFSKTTEGPTTRAEVEIDYPLTESDVVKNTILPVFIQTFDLDPNPIYTRWQQSTGLASGGRRRRIRRAGRSRRVRRPSRSRRARRTSRHR